VELSGTSGASVTADRGKGFRDEIAKHPEMKIIQSQTGDFNRAKARDAMQNIIQARGKEITAVYAHNDEMALGAIQALEAAGMKPGTDVLIISVDGQKSALQAIIDGKMNVTIESNPRFGPLAFATLEKFWAGEKLPPVIIVEDRIFDKTNAAQFLDEAYGT
jgi:ribose transport system substrate-binding protein